MRRAFAARGHQVTSCDLLPADDGSPDHITGDVRNPFIWTRPWDFVIAHPPCQFLSVSGLHWNKRRPERAAQTEAAIAFVRFFWDQPVEKLAIENPIGCLSTRWRKPSQIIQPHRFGEDASKATCLWLRNTPPSRQLRMSRRDGCVVG